MEAPKDNTIEFPFAARVDAAAISKQRGPWPSTISLPGDKTLKSRRADVGAKRICAICGVAGHFAISHIPIDETKLRQCSRCKQMRPPTDFSIVEKRLDGVTKKYRCSRCRKCEAHRSMERRHRQTLDGRLNSILRWTNRWSSRNGFPCEMTFDFLRRLFDRQSGKCFYSGVIMTSWSGPDVISIDRVDPNKPYTVDNVVLCRWMINSMKSSFRVGDFIKACSDVTECQRNRGICA